MMMSSRTSTAADGCRTPDASSLLLMVFGEGAAARSDWPAAGVEPPPPPPPPGAATAGAKALAAKSSPEPLRKLCGGDSTAWWDGPAPGPPPVKSGT